MSDDEKLQDASADVGLDMGDDTSAGIDIATAAPVTQPQVNPIDVPDKQKDVSDQPKDVDPRLVIAIDFGTYGTGYALQWQTDYKTDHLKILHNTKWMSEGFRTNKTPTCLLLRPDETLVEFGYAAETTFGLLGAEDSEEYCDQKQKDWYFFRNFKMKLYDREEINDSTPIESSDGKSLPAIVVFSKAIEYMKNHVLGHLEKSGIPYPESETKWVVTVPAIWNDQAKQVMRNSAEKAGIKSENLVLALEPECAAMYCSEVSKEQLNDVYVPGATIMVVDMGGGTVDITTVQIQDDNNMTQIYMSGGGAWGGMKVDQKFQMMLRDMVGDDVMKKFASDNLLDEYDLRTDFESKKREVKHPTDANANVPFRIKLPPSLKKCWEKKTGKKIKELLQDKKKEATFASGRLSFNLDVIRAFFTETISEITEYVKTVLQKLEQEGQRRLDSIILVGGFAESNFVVQGIRDRLKDWGDIQVVRPHSTELAVLNGAVLFGQNEKKITSRIMMYTYGIGMVMEFNPKKHKADKKFVHNGDTLAMNVFRKHVSRGDEVKLDQWISAKEYYPENEYQDSESVYLYASNKNDPVHTDEDGCTYIGHLEIQFSDPSEVDEDGQLKRAKAIEVALNFGGTEVKVKVINNTIGKEFRKSLKLH